MKEIPEVKNDFGELYEKLLLNQETNLFIAAIELGIFSELSEWKNPGELSEVLDLNPKNTKVLLNSLASVDLIEKKDGRFRNLPATEEFLAEKNDVYLGDFFLSCYRWYNLSSGEICVLVRDGSGDRCMEDMESEDNWTLQAKHSLNYQRAGMVQLAGRIVNSLPEFQSFQKMLDLGCGPGLFGISIAMNHPSMKTILFDRPAIAEVAKEVAEEYGMGDRVGIMAGDYLNDSIGWNYDLVWASMTLNSAGDRLNEVIKKIHESLNPGGVFVSFSDGKTNEGTKPKEMVLGALMASLYWDDDMGLNDGVISGAAIEAGFASVQSRAVLTPIGEVMVDIARKSS